MANRYQNYERQSGQRGGRDWRDDDDERGNRYRMSRDQGEGDQAYGSYADTDEGDSSVRVGSYDEGRTPYRRRGGNYGEPNYGYGRSGGDRGRWGQQGDEGRYGYGGSGTSQRDRWREQNAAAESWSGYGQGGRGQSGSFESGSFGQSGNYGEYASYGTSGNWNQPSENQSFHPRGDFAGEGAGRMGQHRGKGPKGYQRTDDRLKELISERLRDDPHIDPSEVTVSVQGGKITLEGTVENRQTKNAIEDIAEQFGVQEVQNNLRVQKQSQSLGSQSLGTETTRGGKGTSTDEAGGTRLKQH